MHHDAMMIGLKLCAAGLVWLGDERFIQTDKWVHHDVLMTARANDAVRSRVGLGRWWKTSPD